MYFAFGGALPAGEGRGGELRLTLECEGGDPLLAASRERIPIIDLASDQRVLADAWDQKAFGSDAPVHELRLRVSPNEQMTRWYIAVYNFDGA